MNTPLIVHRAYAPDMAGVTILLNRAFAAGAPSVGVFDDRGGSGYYLLEFGTDESTGGLSQDALRSVTEGYWTNANINGEPRA
jgi:hypothetical protein